LPVAIRLQANIQAQKSRHMAGFFMQATLASALARLEAGVGLADDEHLAATAHDLAVAVTLLGGLERG